MKKRPKRTGLLKKLESSVLFAIEVLLLASPAYFITHDIVIYKVTAVAVCFFYVLAGMIRGEAFLCMSIVGEKWERKWYTFKADLSYSILYTLSFASLLFYIRFPFDLLIINLLFLQLPCVLMTGTTLHGFVSGNVASTNGSSLFHLKPKTITSRIRKRRLY